MSNRSWKPIPGWKGFYEAHPTGAVRSVDRVIRILDPWGRRRIRRFKGRKLRPSSLKCGYLTVALSRPKKKPVHFYVHSLILRTFRGKPKEKHECCHNNGVRHDNSLSNLRYDTRRNNARDRHRHGTILRNCGENAPQAKLTWIKVDEIRALKGIQSSRKVASNFGVSHSRILDIWRGRTWKETDRDTVQ